FSEGLRLILRLRNNVGSNGDAGSSRIRGSPCSRLALLCCFLHRRLSGLIRVCRVATGFHLPPNQFGPFVRWSESNWPGLCNPSGSFWSFRRDQACRHSKDGTPPLVFRKNSHSTPARRVLFHSQPSLNIFLSRMPLRCCPRPHATAFCETISARHSSKFYPTM